MNNFTLTCQQEKAKRHERRVTKVQHGGHNIIDLKLLEVVEDGVDKDIDGATTRCEQRPPPPLVVLCTQLHVDKDNRDFGAGDDEHDKDQEEEAEQVVELVLPDGLDKTKKAKKKKKKKKK